MGEAKARAVREQMILDKNWDALCPFAAPLSTDLHLVKFGDHPAGQHYMVVGYYDSTFLVMHDKDEAEHMENLLRWFAKLIAVRKIQPYQ